MAVWMEGRGRGGGAAGWAPGGGAACFRLALLSFRLLLMSSLVRADKEYILIVMQNPNTDERIG